MSKIWIPTSTSTGLDVYSIGPRKMNKEKEKDYRKKRDAMRVRIIEQELLGYDTREAKIKYNKFIDEMTSKGIKFIPRKGYPVYLDPDKPVKIIRKRPALQLAAQPAPQPIIQKPKPLKSFKLIIAWTHKDKLDDPKTLQDYLDNQGGTLIDSELNDTGINIKERILTYKFSVSEENISVIKKSAQFIFDRFLPEYQGVIFVKKKN